MSSPAIPLDSGSNVQPRTKVRSWNRPNHSKSHRSANAQMFWSSSTKSPRTRRFHISKVPDSSWPATSSNLPIQPTVRSRRADSWMKMDHRIRHQQVISFESKITKLMFLKMKFAAGHKKSRRSVILRKERKFWQQMPLKSNSCRSAFKRWAKARNLLLRSFWNMTGSAPPDSLRAQIGAKHWPTLMKSTARWRSARSRSALVASVCNIRRMESLRCEVVRHGW